MTHTQVSSEHSQPLFLRINNRNAASRALNLIRAENYAERTQQTQLQAKSAEQTASSLSTTNSKTDDFGFEDILDMINPLHHIPIVSTLYQDLTGDTISAPAKIMGGGLFGGIAGLAGSLVDAIIEEVSGLDVGHHVLAFFTGDPDETGGHETQPKTVPAQTASLTTNAPLPENLVPAKMLTPKNTGGIQLASRTTPKETPPSSTTLLNSTQPEMPDIPDRIGEPKTAWSNRPNLSPTAFNALLTSFGESTKTAQAIAQKVAPTSRSDITGTRTRGAAEIIQASTLSQSKYAGPHTSTPINDLLSQMQNGLDKYDQSKNQALRHTAYQSLQ